MNDALGQPRSLVVLGGTSEIGLAITGRLIARGARTVVLAGRDETALKVAARRLGERAAVHTVGFDALRIEHQREVVEEIARRCGDIDLVLCAVGMLDDQAALADDPERAAELMATNYVGPAATLLHLAKRLRAQGHGRVVVLSSAAGERARAANYIYGSSKAGLDTFAQGLGDALEDAGIKVTVVRPGFVRTRMTAGRDPAPLATTPEQVASVVVRGLEQDAHTVWAPATLRWLMVVLRHLPRPLFRRLAR